MSALVPQVQAALVAALAAAPALAALGGIYDGPPPRAAFPYATISDAVATDWSSKTERGREIRVQLAIWDDGDAPARLRDLAAAAEDVIEAMPRDLAGARIASLVLVRARTVRSATGPWAATIEYRLRVLETS